MPKFRVTFECVSTEACILYVDADSAEEAKRIVEEGDFDWDEVKCDLQDTVKTEIEVEDPDE